MAFRWHAHVGPTLNTGLVALLYFRGSGPVLKIHIFVIFPCPPLSGYAYVPTTPRGNILQTRMIYLYTISWLHLQELCYIRNFKWSSVIQMYKYIFKA